jgi:hypothetical protein
VADERINTWVSSPFKILALATYRLRPGGEAVIDAQVPSNAIDDLGPNDIFIWLNDGGDARPNFPKRPDRFAQPELCGDNFARLCPDDEGGASPSPASAPGGSDSVIRDAGSTRSSAWGSGRTAIRRGPSSRGTC